MIIILTVGFFYQYSHQTSDPLLLTMVSSCDLTFILRRVFLSMIYISSSSLPSLQVPPSTGSQNQPSTPWLLMRSMPPPTHQLRPLLHSPCSLLVHLVRPSQVFTYIHHELFTFTSLLSCVENSKLQAGILVSHLGHRGRSKASFYFCRFFSATKLQRKNFCMT